MPDLGPDPSWEVQKAIYARLTSELPNIPVIDNVEASEFEDTLPFILIGDDLLVDDENQVTEDYQLSTFIRCHAEGPSRKASKALAHQVRAAMKAPFQIEGFVSDDMISYHKGTQSVLIEGVAHAVIVEWRFDLLEYTE